MSKIYKGKIKSQAFVFIVSATFLFLKNVLFQGMLFEDLYFTRPVEAFKFYGASVATSLFLSGFVFLFKNNRWTCILHLLIDIWIVANIVFYRSNELFLTVDAIMVIDNMSGFWSSTLAYLNWKSYIFPLMTSIYAVIIWRISEAEKRHWRLFVLCT